MKALNVLFAVLTVSVMGQTSSVAEAQSYPYGGYQVAPWNGWATVPQYSWNSYRGMPSATTGGCANGRCGTSSAYGASNYYSAPNYGVSTYRYPTYSSGTVDRFGLPGSMGCTNGQCAACPNGVCNTNSGYRAPAMGLGTRSGFGEFIPAPRDFDTWKTPSNSRSFDRYRDELPPVRNDFGRSNSPFYE